MRLVFAGTPELALPSLHALVAAGHQVVGVLTRPDAPAGRGKQLTSSPVARAAAALGIEVLRPTSLRDGRLAADLARLDPECVPVVAYGALIPADLLVLPRHGWVNLHFSLLPAWRGAAPVQRALMAGDEYTGVTTFRIVPALDAGPVYRQVRTPFGAGETAGAALSRLAELGAGVLAATIEDIAAGSTPVEQDEAGLSLAPKVEVADARIDWTRPAQRISDLVRGTTPAPGAWTTIDGERFKVLTVALVESAAPVLQPGELLAQKHRLLAGTGSGVLELVQVQAVGRRPMSGADWARGAKPAPGLRCE